MDSSIQKLIQLIIKEIIKELVEQGIIKNSDIEKSREFNFGQSIRNKVEKIDMSKYRTPILTENQINHLHELTGQIIVPKGTVITPKAKEVLKTKQISLKIE